MREEPVKSDGDAETTQHQSHNQHKKINRAHPHLPAYYYKARYYKCRHQHRAQREHVNQIETEGASLPQNALLDGLTKRFKICVVMLVHRYTTRTNVSFVNDIRQ